jgi:Na+/H+ antiporter NhaD/arsenite permease-like protein
MTSTTPLPPIAVAPTGQRRSTRHTNLRRRDGRARDRSNQVDTGATTRRERLRAHAALVTLWGALTVTILAYAITRGSVGGAFLAVAVAWVTHLASTALRRSRQHDDAQPTRPISFTP